MHLKAVVAASFLPGLLAPTLQAQVVAYVVTAGTAGNQDVNGSALGMDFDVNAPITVTRLGVFDSGSDGLVHLLTAQIYNRDTQLPVTPLITFAAGTGPASGTLIGGSRFLDITPLALLTGFHGSIVASHYDAAEPDFNTLGNPNSTATTDTGGGRISFVGESRFAGGVADVYPTILAGGPANRFDAGTFAFAVPVPEPSGLALAGLAAAGALGLRRSRRRQLVLNSPSPAPDDKFLDFDTSPPIPSGPRRDGHGYSGGRRPGAGPVPPRIEQGGMSMAVRRTVLAVFVAAAVGGAAARGQVIAPAFAGNYSFTDLGPAPGVPGLICGLTLKAGDPNTLLLGGAGDSPAGAIYQIGVTRGAGNHITGFSGAAAPFSTAPNIDGGLAYGPNNVLFYTAFPVNTLGQIKPGSSAPDKLIDLTPLGVASSTGPVAFVPAGFPGAGGIRIASFNGGGFYSATLTPDGTGTFGLSAMTLLTTTVNGPDGMVYVPSAAPVFAGPSVLISEQQSLANRISAYGLDAGGVPIPGSRQNFMTGLASAGASLDPLTGDFLFSTFQPDHVLVVAPSAVPEPSGLLLAGSAAGGLLALRRRRRTRALHLMTAAPGRRDP